MRRVLSPWLLALSLGVAGASVLAGAVRVAARPSTPRAAELPVLGHIPRFEMTDQAGRPVGDRTLQGEVLVVDFFFARCTTSCPRLTGKMLGVQAALAAEEARSGHPLSVHLVSITLDPANDTPDVLRAYAAETGADTNRWSFLSGRSEDLNRVVADGFHYRFERADPSAGVGAIMHGEWIALVDGEGALRGFYAASDPERMDALVVDAVRLARGPTPTPVVAVVASPHPLATTPPSSSTSAPSYHARGVIRSFGPARAFVSIAHEDIPGYMQAMTMSFEPGAPGQLDGLAVGDRVQFDFTETADARRVLGRIEKAP